jgi:hypothetical protein
MAQVITEEHADGSVTTTVIENGRRWSDRISPQEAARLALALLGGSTVGYFGDGFCRRDMAGACFGVGATNKVRVRDYSAPANFSWDSLSRADQAKYGGSIDRWWRAIGKDARVSTRASFAAMRAEVPDMTPAQARAWWGGLAVKTRQRLREKHSPGYGDDFFDDIKKVVDPIAKTIEKLAPIAEQIPGFGPMVAQGIRQGAQTAQAISNPAEALLVLSGGPVGLQAGGSAIALVKGASVSKVLDRAAKDLAAAAPAASNKLAATSKLNLASMAAGLGVPASAEQLARKATGELMKSAKEGKISAKQAGELLSQAKAAKDRLMTAAAAPGSRELIDRARMGRVRSNRGGTVTPAELAAAAAAGRVFYVH